MAAGLLVLLIALTLIMLKLGFLLLLVAGPFFLIIGTHPGFGRVIAIRWFEMLVGVLMKQVAIALVLSVLLYCYSLIMSTTDTALPWALKIMMIALVTVAVFIYRKPFQHLFSSVGYGVLGSEERAEYSWREASYGFRRASATAAGVAIPSVAAYRAARWARRHPATTAAGRRCGPAGGLGHGGHARRRGRGGHRVAPAGRPAGRGWPRHGPAATGRTVVADRRRRRLGRLRRVRWLRRRRPGQTVAGGRERRRPGGTAATAATARRRVSTRGRLGGLGPRLVGALNHQRSVRGFRPRSGLRSGGQRQSLRSAAGPG